MAKGIKVAVHYTGQAHRRIVERYEWNASNGFVQTVTSKAMVERLLANGDFVLVQVDEAQAKDEQEKSQP